MKTVTLKTITLAILAQMLLLLLNCGNTEPANGTEPEETEDTSSWGSAEEINHRLGRGMNFGNTFEAQPSWQSRFDPQDMKRIADLGFTHVRVPIRWERDDRSVDSAPYTIYPDFLKTIEEVVDEALKNKLHIIINMHHHDALYADPAGQRERFLAQWEQIAEHFKSYPDSLLFEILNEPHDRLDAALWNRYSKEALQVIRRSNPERCVLLGVAEWGGVEALASLEIPDDPHLILTIHYYNPFHFTHQGAEWVEGSDAWLGTEWHDTEYERAMVREDFQPALELAQKKRIPVHIGEFGAFSKADMPSRVRWTQYLARWFEQQGFSWAYWEWNNSFGIYDPNNDSYREGLTDALLKNPIPDPASPSLTTLYASTFNETNNDGWSLYNNHSSASSSATFHKGAATITISQPGSEIWHVQFIKNGMPLQKGKTYLLSFEAFTPKGESGSVHFGFSMADDPWTGYAEKGVSLNKTKSKYELLFTANQSDPQARMLFSLGASGISEVTLSDIRWSEVTF